MEVVRLIGRGKVPAGAVRIDRRSRFGNPHKIGEAGDREEVIRKFREDIERRKQSDPIGLMLDLIELEGKDLACWCAPEPCHGEVWIEAVEWMQRIRERARKIEQERKAG